MKHIVVGNQKHNVIRHEYWETEKYEKHLQEPYCGRWTPYYVCYVYPNS